MATTNLNIPSDALVVAATEELGENLNQYLNASPGGESFLKRDVIAANPHSATAQLVKFQGSDPHVIHSNVNIVKPLIQCVQVFLMNAENPAVETFDFDTALQELRSILNNAGLKFNEQSDPNEQGIKQKLLGTINTLDGRLSNNRSTRDNVFQMVLRTLKPDSFRGQGLQKQIDCFIKNYSPETPEPEVQNIHKLTL